MLEILLHGFTGEDVLSLPPVPAKKHPFGLHVSVSNFSDKKAKRKQPPKHLHFLCKAGLMHSLPFLC